MLTGGYTHSAGKLVVLKYLATTGVRVSSVFRKKICVSLLLVVVVGVHVCHSFLEYPGTVPGYGYPY